jgi:hypothetical protein
LVKQHCGRLKLLVREFDRVAVQLDVSADLLAVAASERTASRELALGGDELSLGNVARLGERAALLLEEPEVQLFLRAEPVPFDLGTRFVPGSRWERPLVEGE